MNKQRPAMQALNSVFSKEQADVLLALGSSPTQDAEGEGLSPEERAKLGGLSRLATTAAWEDLNKPAVVAAGSSQEAARTAIGAMPQHMLGVPDGAAQLDGAGKVLLSQLNIVGTSYKGLWDASTNTPTITNGTGEDADFYFVSEDGTPDLGGGAQEFSKGDIAIYFDGVWGRVGSSHAIQTVNGQTGNVVITRESLGALPDSYQPEWDDILNKPSLPAMHRGRIGQAVPALRMQLTTAQTVPNTTRVKVVNWGDGYDQFSMRSGGDFVIPAWASYARVVCTLATAHLSAPNSLHMDIRRNDAVMATGMGRGMDTAASPSATADTGVMPVSGGNRISVHAWHNYGSSRNIHAAGGTNINIELYEST